MHMVGYYQQQMDENKMLVWRMIDMHTRIMPKHMHISRVNCMKLTVNSISITWTLFVKHLSLLGSSTIITYLQHYDLSGPQHRQLLRIRLTYQVPFSCSI